MMAMSKVCAVIAMMNAVALMDGVVTTCSIILHQSTMRNAQQMLDANTWKMKRSC